MTVEAYNKATKILEEKKLLEEKLEQLRIDIRMGINFVSSAEYIEICNRLFALGQEFAAL